MKYPKNRVCRALLCAGLFITMLAPATHARVGESQSSIERRLSSAGSIIYRDDAVEASRQKGMPYMALMDFIPDSADLRIYFKTTDGRKPKSSDMEVNKMTPGWDLHVIYLRGSSVLEIYQRSQAMTEFELNQLLALQAGGAFWKKVAPGKAPEGTPPTAFGYTMERSDGKLRAKQLGPTTLMVFDTAFDAMLFEERASNQQELAPNSIRGF